MTTDIPDVEPSTDKAVVVGVDGSEHADAALRYALAEAARRGTHVVAVVAWGPWDIFGGYSALEDPDVAERRLREQAEAHVRRVHQAKGVPDVPLELAFHVGGAAEVLVDLARPAALLVVGHRGRGRVRSMIGSVGLRCVLRAPCPVTVVPGVDGTEPHPAPS
ncbi:MAG TPA: universal stress protein [Actinomycetospora sp.]|nr:universal stress protein [Actinomycetospora sp.]